MQAKEVSQKMRENNNEVLVQIKNLKKYFEIKKNVYLKAVDDITFDIYKGETFGLVGESGCGKTTVGRTLLGIYTASGGTVIFDGKDVNKLQGRNIREFKKRAQMIFQDPYASLNPRMLVSNIIAEGLDIHGICKGEERATRIYELLDLVGLNREHANRFPHEFSGGQRQRIGIARALAVDPDFIVCDEPISALDVSIQAQIINTLARLQKSLGLTYLFIAHDISMVKYISDRIGVMYLGKLVEIAESNELYTSPLHPYTQALLSAVPIPDPEKAIAKHRIILEGDVPSPINIPNGCRFRERCSFAMPMCAETQPELKEITTGHFVACFLTEK